MFDIILFICSLILVGLIGYIVGVKDKSAAAVRLSNQKQWLLKDNTAKGRTILQEITLRQGLQSTIRKLRVTVQANKIEGAINLLETYDRLYGSNADLMDAYKAYVDNLK